VKRSGSLWIAGAFSALALTAATAQTPPAQGGISLGEPKPFSFEMLAKEAKALAASDYQDKEIPDKDLVAKIDYLVHGKIRFKTDEALWIGSKKQFAVSLFHVGKYFSRPVDFFLVEDGKAREVTASKDVFDFPPDSPAAEMKSPRRIAGFKIQEDKNGKLNWRTNDWVAFLGASYFRSIGEQFQYGLSARGLAVNTANPQPPFNEEFPYFSKFWLESPESGPTILIYALLEGPSVTGAYRFEIERKSQVVMEVEADLFVRKDIVRFGIAPLTSMYWFSETAKPGIVDWRPEVHDSDGLSIAKGNGERIWRPLNNPPRLRVSAFQDENPKGFGLMQRDREFSSYLEDGAYERRPSLWVDTLGDWGKGAVELIELPTVDESEDNIVAFWVPEQPAKAGSEVDLRYRLTWEADEPNFANLSRVVATRLVREPMKRWPATEQRFIVEFAGGPLGKAPNDTILSTDLWASRGECSDVQIQPMMVDGQKIWRVKFTLKGIEGIDPIEMRLCLKKDDQPITETWLYQFNPEVR